MFIASLFILPKTESNQDEWITKPWYICTIEYYSGVKKKLLSHKKTWRKLKCTLLSERSQSEKATSYIIKA